MLKCRSEHILLALISVVSIATFKSYNVSAENTGFAIDNEATCITSSCHDNMGKKKYAHAIGVDGKKCAICHEIIREGIHIFQGIPLITEDLCAKCHKEVLPEPEKPEEKPSDRKSLSLEDILDKMPEKEAPPDGKLAPKVISKSDNLQLHAPFAEGKCTACHDPHESDNYRHLKLPYPVGIYARFSAGTYSLCFTKCHIGLEDAFIEPRTLDLTQFRNGNLNLHFRHVNKKKGRACIICHHNHGTGNPMLIKDNFQFGNMLLTIGYEKTETGGKCATTCHRTARYDRYEPIFNLIKTSLRPGTDATEEELKDSKERDIKRQEEKVKQKGAQE